MSLWKWNDVELEIDMEDVDFLEKYEGAFDNLDIKEKELQKTGKKSEIARGYCGMFYNLFDEIFGPGTGKKLMGEKMNVRICDANKRQNAMINKFKPNRTQRRAAGKK